MAELIDFSKFTRRTVEAEREGVSWQKQPQRETRSQPEKERMPDWYQRVQSRTAGPVNDWSGGNWAGRNWGGGRER